MLATVLLLGLLAVAAATDLGRHRIYNWTTYPGILAAWAIHGAGEVWVAAAGGDRGAAERWLGWVGLGSSLLGFALCGGVLLVCFVLFRVGGGDVKLIAMLGAFLGAEQGLEAMLWTFVLGACSAVIVLVWRVGPVRLAAALWRHLAWTVRLGRLSTLTPAERAHLQPPLFLAPSALAAALIVRFRLDQLLGTILGL
ncbi:MAG: A24 family peptidase [Thermoguttaceae bacterium]